MIRLKLTFNKSHLSVHHKPKLYSTHNNSLHNTNGQPPPAACGMAILICLHLREQIQINNITNPTIQLKPGNTDIKLVTVTVENTPKKYNDIQEPEY